MNNNDKEISPNTKTVICGGRLHMGFFDLHGGLGRRFGSIGLSLSEPCLHITASISPKTKIDGVPHVSQTSLARAESLTAHFLEKLNIQGKPYHSGVHIFIAQHIPEHAGLGSGTQLALAIGTAIKSVLQLKISTAQLAEIAGRGSRSGIGIAAFDQGGLLIDGGRLSSQIDLTARDRPKIPPLIARYDFPAAWHVLLIFDTSEPGIHGEEEIEAFASLPAFSENLAAHLCRHVLMQAMPALVEQDLYAFGQAIQVLQSVVGDYFSPAQGGRYASKLVGSVLQHLGDSGVSCYGQSSWGPTGFAIFESKAAAEAQLATLNITFANTALRWQICSAMNHGATLS